MPHTASPFYYFFFTTIDPLLSLSAVYMHFFSPQTILASAFPPSSPWSIVTPSHTVLMQQAGGMLSMFAFLMIFMLRATEDLKVWKYFEAGVFIVDLATFWSMWGALEVQGRLGLEEWRWEEWVSFAILVAVSVMRVTFLMGFGNRERRVAKKGE